MAAPLSHFCVSSRRGAKAMKTEVEQVSTRTEKTLGARVKIVDGDIVVTEAETACSDPPSRRGGERWGLEETRRFYAALQQCGTDFTLMQSLFPNRTQRELKRKYHREEREHAPLVALALGLAAPLATDVAVVVQTQADQPPHALRYQNDDDDDLVAL